jgi:hypothetical protein
MSSEGTHCNTMKVLLNIVINWNIVISQNNTNFTHHKWCPLYTYYRFASTPVLKSSPDFSLTFHRYFEVR